jgi:rubrerythrin
MVKIKMETKTFTKTIPPLVRKQILQAQRNEVTEYHIYKRLARETTNKDQKRILNSIAEDELKHYKIWMKYSGREVNPGKWNLFKYYWLTKLFGLAFGLKQMELGEKRAQVNYNEIGKEIPEALQIAKEETQHEQELLTLLKSNS